MLPKIAAHARACQEDARDVCRRLDERLFEPGVFFALDATNRRVPGVPVASLEHGHDLIAQGGAVASIVGRLRDLGGTASTDEFTDAVIARLQA